jgi:hypothetical protein
LHVVEQVPGAGKQLASVSASDVGQAHNQLARAVTDLGNQGHVVRGTIVTHLADLDAAAAASIGAIKVVRKDAVAALLRQL